mgnify:CR=1 FL=1
MNLEKRLEWFFDRKLIMLFLFEERFLNPLIPDEMVWLKRSGLLEDDLTLLVLEEKLTKCISHLPKGMYFPVAISKALKNGERVELRDIFSLEPRIQKARISRNPKTNEKVNTPEKKAILFKMSKEWTKKVNE